MENNNVDYSWGFNYAADQIVNKKTDDELVKKELIAKGFQEEDADKIIYNIHFQVESEIEERKHKAKNNMIYGALWCIGGIIVTAISYSSVSSGGGQYVITWGAIVFGGIQFFMGLINYNS